MRIDVDEEEMKKAKKLEIKRIIRSETMKKKFFDCTSVVSNKREVEK